jgi:carbon storage regulator CsrA
MLVLTRKNGETISIGRGIEVKVLSINRHAVKLGFSAPPDVVIRREELHPFRGQDPVSEGSSLASAGAGAGMH